MCIRRVYFICPFLAGCLAFGYPVILKTPGVLLPTSEVRAFRIVSDNEGGGFLVAGWIRHGHSVEEIPVVNATIESQREAHFAYYYLLFPLHGGHGRSLKVLLYRPGYETVEIPARSWWNVPGKSLPEKVAWKEAPDLPAQKAAIDRIVPEIHRGGVSKDILQFAAREYARLANSPLISAAGMESLRDELLAAAKECEELASKKRLQPTLPPENTTTGDGTGDADH